MFFIKIILLYILLVIVQYLYFHIINKNIYKQLKNVNYINKKYNLNLSGNELKKLSIYLILIDSFIICVPLVIFIFLKVNYFIKLLITSVLFIVLILTLYNTLGNILKKKVGK